MRLVLARAYGTPPAGGEEAAFAGAEPMPLAYERRVREADALADRRADELTRVQDAERLGRAVAARAEPLQAAVSEEAAAAEALATAQDAWARAVAPLGLTPGTTVGEVRQALAARTAVIAALAAFEMAADGEAALTRRHAGWADRLAACMGVPAAPLPTLLAAADQVVAWTRAAEKAAAAGQAIRESAARALPLAEDAERQATDAVRRWHDCWAVLLGRLGRQPEASTTAVTADLEAIATLEGHHRDGLSLAGRIEGMQADLDKFAATVRALAEEAGQPPGASPAATARELIARGTRASAAHAAWEQARKADEGAEEAVAKARIGCGKRRGHSTGWSPPAERRTRRVPKRG